MWVVLAFIFSNLFSFFFAYIIGFLKGFSKGGEAERKIESERILRMKEEMEYESVQKKKS